MSSIENDLFFSSKYFSMSIRDKPVANRICAMEDREYAYKKHLKAIAEAKPTIDTSKPDVALKFRDPDEAEMIAQTKQVKTNVQRSPKTVKRHSASNIEPEQETIESIKIGYDGDDSIEVEETIINPKKKKSRIPIRSEVSPSKANYVSIEIKQPKKENQIFQDTRQSLEKNEDSGPTKKNDSKLTPENDLDFPDDFVESRPTTSKDKSGKADKTDQSATNFDDLETFD